MKKKPLTGHELKILHLLPTELSTRVPGHLVVLINTIKTRLKNICPGLDAHSREEVVEEAGTLNLQ